jgi:hypothetical protein
MEDQKKHIEDLSEIRSMMERASKFISLSGISGISAGIFALIGAAIAYWYLEFHYPKASEPILFNSLTILEDGIVFLFLLSILVFFGAFAVAVFFTTRNSRIKKIPIWDYSSKRLLFNLMFPLTIGGLFIVALIYYNSYFLIIPSSLIFYGIALINGGHFTYSDIKYLGYFEIFLGLVALIFINLGMYIWALGFGVLHIIYGSIMYFKYEK